MSDPFVCRCLTSLSLLRFHFPLGEPDVRISRIRLSDKVLRFCPRKVTGALFQSHQAKLLI